MTLKELYETGLKKFKVVIYGTEYEGVGVRQVSSTGKYFEVTVLPLHTKNVMLKEEGRDPRNMPDYDTQRFVLDGDVEVTPLGKKSDVKPSAQHLFKGGKKKVKKDGQTTSS